MSLWDEAREIAKDKKQREILRKMYDVVTDVCKILNIIMLESAVREVEREKYEEADMSALWGE